MGQSTNIQGADIPIVNLIPLRKREVTPRAYAKLQANIRAVGLIDPLCVCKDRGSFYILDGYLRYQILLELGFEVIPCLFLESKDLYTPNRQVQNLSAKQEVAHLRSALKRIDEKTLAAAFGLKSISNRLGTAMSKELHPTVLRALEDGEIARGVAKEFTLVVPKRQVEILRMMRDAKDKSLGFARTQILRTPPAQRSTKKLTRSPWERGIERKKNLVGKLQQIEKHHDFYSLMYRQYTGDLLKLAIYVRQIISRPLLRKYLHGEHREILELFEGLMQENEGKSVAV